jgi:hypothetical protein
MHQIVSGLVTRPADAQKIIDELVSSCACDRSDIGLLAGGGAGQVTSSLGRGMQATGHAAATVGGAMADTLRDLLGAASQGASQKASLFGGLSAAGKLAALVSKNALNTVAELSRALVDFGVQETLAVQYAKSLRDGGILLIVRAHSERMAQCARGVLATHGATTDAWPHARDAHERRTAI